MPLPMARPWKHHNGVYYARKGVPAHLRPLVGKWTVMVSLGTKDLDEARRLHPEAIREIEEWLAALEVGPKALSEREAHELASPVRDDWVALHLDNPSRNPWRTDLFERLWRNRRAGLWGRPDLIHQVLHGEYADRGEDGMEVLCFEQADQLIEAKGLVVDKDGRRTLAKAVGASLQRASLTLERFALGDVGDEAPPVRPRSAASVPAAKAPPSKVEFDELVEGWAAERKPAEKTLYDWKRVMVQLAEFLGHRDAARVTSEDLIAWKNSLVASGLAAKTIRESRLAPVRAILRWGVDNRRLTDNAAERITISVKQKPGQGKRGFKDAEAAQILQAAATESDPVKRWVPLVCAYSGARLSEVCQLRVQDISESTGSPSCTSMPTPGR